VYGWMLGGYGVRGIFSACVRMLLLSIIPWGWSFPYRPSFLFVSVMVVVGVDRVVERTQENIGITDKGARINIRAVHQNSITNDAIPCPLNGTILRFQRDITVKQIQIDT
jgi:hypothetical protein